MKTSNVWFTVAVLGLLTLGLSLGTFRDSDSSDNDEDGDSAFALTHGHVTAPTAIQVQFRLIRS